MKQVLFLFILTGCLLCHHVSPGYSSPTIEVKASLELAGGDSTRALQKEKAEVEAAERAANYFNDVGFIHFKKEGTADFQVKLKLREELGKTRLKVYSDAEMFVMLDAETKKTEKIATTAQKFEAKIINGNIDSALRKACKLVGRRSAKFLVKELEDKRDRLNRDYQLVFTGFEDDEENQIVEAIKELALRDDDIKDDVREQEANPLKISVTMRVYKKLSEVVDDLKILLEAKNIKVAQGSDYDGDTISLIKEAQAGDAVVIDD